MEICRLNPGVRSSVGGLELVREKLTLDRQSSLKKIKSTERNMSYSLDQKTIQIKRRKQADMFSKPRERREDSQNFLCSKYLKKEVLSR